MGLYVVHGVKKASDDESVTAGRTLRYSNVACTYNGSTGKWSVAQVGGKSVIMYPGDSYYFYYPYQSSPSGYPNECNEVGASAQTFFSSVITAHTVETDQSKIADFVSSDLQVAKAVTPEEDNDLAASTIKASMARQVGLARFQMATSKQIPNELIYTNGSLTSTSSAKTTVAPTVDFVGNIPYISGDCWFYTLVGEPVSFSGNPTNADKWTEAVNITINEAGTTNSTIPVAHSVRENWTCTVSTTWKYNYRNSPYTFVSTDPGNYLMECYGAQGGTGLANGQKTTGVGGMGGYAKGTLTLNTATTFFIYVGGKGADGVLQQTASGGWNGGGNGCWDNLDDESAGGGGGATDIRYTGGTWNTFSSLRTRIMVAGGGGGGAYTLKGGAGGGTSGTAGIGEKRNTTPATQISGYRFGWGQAASRYATNVDQGGGGGGYYGAAAITSGDEQSVSGAGGLVLSQDCLAVMPSLRALQRAVLVIVAHPITFRVMCSPTRL